MTEPGVPLGGDRPLGSGVPLGGDRPPGSAIPSGGGPLPPSGVSLGGFLLLDKPPGLSSFQALYPVKKLFRGLKVGHAGTLDPAASGLLLVGVGSGTRLLEYLEGMPKTYAFLARFGLVSDTYDMEGAVSGAPDLALDRARVEAALAPFRGCIRQAPPAYSAVKVDGARAYDLARAGSAPVLAEREVEVMSLELLAFADGVAELRMTCSKGTYVRSLVHDLGQALGPGAVADRIRREAIGPFRLEDALPHADLVAALAARRATQGGTHPPEGTPAQLAQPSPAAPDGLRLLPLETAVAGLPAAVLAPHRLAALRDGRSTSRGGYTPRGEAPTPGADVAVLDDQGRLLAIADLSPEGELRPRKVLFRP